MNNEHNTSIVADAASAHLIAFIQKHTRWKPLSPENWGHGDSECSYDMGFSDIIVIDNPNIGEFCSILAKTSQQLGKIWDGKDKIGLFEGQLDYSRIGDWLDNPEPAIPFMALMRHFGFVEIYNPFSKMRNWDREDAKILFNIVNAPSMTATAEGKLKYDLILIGDIPGPEVGAPKPRARGPEA